MDDTPIPPPIDHCIYCERKLPEGKGAACAKGPCAEKFAVAVADFDGGIPPWSSDQAEQDDPLSFTE